jgi:hypothetical protein
MTPRRDDRRFCRRRRGAAGAISLCPFDRRLSVTSALAGRATALPGAVRIVGCGGAIGLAPYLSAPADRIDKMYPSRRRSRCGKSVAAREEGRPALMIAPPPPEAG